jgi:hypothetical protein
MDDVVVINIQDTGDVVAHLAGWVQEEAQCPWDLCAFRIVIKITA